MRCSICLWFRVDYEIFVVSRVSMLEAVRCVGLKVASTRLRFSFEGKDMSS